MKGGCDDLKPESDNSFSTGTIKYRASPATGMRWSPERHRLRPRRQASSLPNTRAVMTATGLVRT
jgi:hypothetical protein